MYKALQGSSASGTIPRQNKAAACNRIIEMLRLGKTSEIIESNHLSSTAMSPNATHKKQQMGPGHMENRRKPGDGIKQCKLWHPVALNTFQAFAGIPARKIRDMGMERGE